MTPMVKRQTSADYVYQILKDRIVSKYYEKGEQLKEFKISKELETSPTPVREALRKLSNEGFLERNPYKGVMVKSYTLEDQREAYLVYGKIHLLYFKWAIETFDHKQNDELVDLLQQRLLELSNQHLFVKVQPFFLWLREAVNSQVLEACLASIQAVVNLQAAINHTYDIEKTLEGLYNELLSALIQKDFIKIESIFDQIIDLSIATLRNSQKEEGEY